MKNEPKVEVSTQFAETIEKENLIPAGAFMHEVGGTSRIFGRDSDINVVFEGDEAGTDGSTIYYPAIDAQSFLTEEEVKIGRGYVDHESAHIRHTDMPFWNKKAKQLVIAENYLLKDMFNAVEDMRIEREVLKTYRGAKKNLSAVANAVTGFYLEKYKENPSIVEDVKRITPVAFTWAGRVDMQYEGKILTDAMKTLPAGLRNALNIWVNESKKCKTTQDAYELARRIIHDIKNEKHEDEDYKPNQVGQGMSSEDPTNDIQVSNSSNPMEDRKQERQARQAKEQQQESSLQCEDGRYNPEDFIPLNPDITDFMNNSFQNMAEPEYGKYVVASTRFDLVHTAYDGVRPAKTGGDREAYKGAYCMAKYRSPEEYRKTLQKASGSLNVMKRKLERSIQSKYKIDWDSGKEYGRLDSRRLAQAYQAKPNVYKDRCDAEYLDTAVTVLVDHSGSMGGRKAKVAQQVSICLSECLHKIGAEFEVLGFNNYPAFKTKQDEKEWHHTIAGYSYENKYQRVTPLHIYQYKAFEEKYARCKDVLTSMVKNVDGYNCDGDALIFAGERLLARSEKRKILLVLSDGQPAGDSSFKIDKTFLRNMVHRYETAGIDLIGIGICSDAVSQFYPKWVVCNNIEELPKTTMDMVSKALLGDRFIVDNSDLIALRNQVKV